MDDHKLDDHNGYRIVSFLSFKIPGLDNQVIFRHLITV